MRSKKKGGGGEREDTLTVQSNFPESGQRSDGGAEIRALRPSARIQEVRCHHNRGEVMIWKLRKSEQYLATPKISSGSRGTWERKTKQSG